MATKIQTVRSAAVAAIEVHMVLPRVVIGNATPGNTPDLSTQRQGEVNVARPPRRDYRLWCRGHPRAGRDVLAGVPINESLRPTRGQAITGGASLASYAIGYPVAIVGGSWIGWALVMLGGVFLLAFGVLTVQRITKDS